MKYFPTWKIRMKITNEKLKRSHGSEIDRTMDVCEGFIK